VCGGEEKEEEEEEGRRVGLEAGSSAARRKGMASRLLVPHELCSSTTGKGWASPAKLKLLCWNSPSALGLEPWAVTAADEKGDAGEQEKLKPCSGKWDMEEEWRSKVAG